VADRRQLIRAAAVIDADGVSAAPGALLLEGSRVIAAGRPEEVGGVGDAEVVECSGVIIPALVNAHTHLDLTDLGPRPRPRTHESSFVDWIRMIRSARKSRTDAEIAGGVRRGVELSRKGGTALVGDIAGSGSVVPTHVLRECELPGLSFLEVFGLGKRQDAAIARMKTAVDNIPAFENGVALGLQPHALYSCGPRVYSAAAALGLPIATHLSETPEEAEFTRSGSGPFRDFLKELDLWDDSIDVSGEHPVDAVLQTVDNLSIRRPWAIDAQEVRPTGHRPEGPVSNSQGLLAIHLNYISDHHLERLAASRVNVVYCPRASAYFGHTGHRYRDMLACGGDINVALGTDSIVCLDTPERLSVLDEMRLLCERDGAPVELLLRMATTAGARALGFDESLFTFSAGTVAGVLALEPVDDAPRNAGATALLASAISHAQAPQWIIGPLPCELFSRA
jgi:cytosine/adenosine deaminase-related metal-dependent hydrolase